MGNESSTNWSLCDDVEFGMAFNNAKKTGQLVSLGKGAQGEVFALSNHPTFGRFALKKYKWADDVFARTSVVRNIWLKSKMKKQGRLGVSTYMGVFTDNETGDKFLVMERITPVDEFGRHIEFHPNYKETMEGYKHIPAHMSEDLATDLGTLMAMMHLQSHIYCPDLQLLYGRTVDDPTPKFFVIDIDGWHKRDVVPDQYTRPNTHFIRMCRDNLDNLPLPNKTLHNTAKQAYVKAARVLDPFGLSLAETPLYHHMQELQAFEQNKFPPDRFKRMNEIGRESHNTSPYPMAQAIVSSEMPDPIDMAHIANIEHTVTPTGKMLTSVKQRRRREKEKKSTCAVKGLNR